MRKKYTTLLKQVIAFVFLLAFALQTFNRAIILFDYEANTKSYIAMCENKAKPKMHCNGKCQMMKKLKQEEKKDEQNPERKTENKAELVLSSKSYYPSVNFAATLQVNVYPLLNGSNEIKMPRSLLRPPIC